MALRQPESGAAPRELDENELDELSCAVADTCVLWLQNRHIELTPLVLRQIGAALIGLGARSIEETHSDATVVLALAAESMKASRN